MVFNHDIYTPLYTDTDKFIILITGGRGCEDPDTEVIMSDLTIRRIKDVKVGEYVMGDDGTPRKVLNTVSGRSMMYKVHQANAEDYIVNDSHVLCLKKRKSSMLPYGLTKKGTPRRPNGRYPQYPEYSEIPIFEYMAKSSRFRTNFSGYKSGSIPYKEAEVPVSPYYLGLWLGDGNSHNQNITNPDIEVREFLRNYSRELGLCYYEKEQPGCYYIRMSKRPKDATNILLEKLRSLSVINSKHVPQSYISNSESVRLELLAGIIDTDGTYDPRGEYEITQKSKYLAKQIKFVADTLGFRTKLSEKRARIGTKDCGIYYRLNISGDISRIPCKVKRKKASEAHYENRSWLVSSLNIEQLGEGEYFGFQLDGNHRYLHADGTVMRNSGKSFSASTFIERLTFELGFDEETAKKVAHQILYTRYTMVSANISVIPEFMEKIEADGTGRYFHTTKTDVVNKMTGSHIMFRGLMTSSGNQTAKLKSIHGITTFVVDEAEEWVSEKEFETIMYSIRQKNLRNRIIVIMNPTDSNHFIYQKYIKDTHRIEMYDGVPVQISTHPNVLHIHTSYLDNLQYLSEQFISEAKLMKQKNPEKYAHIFMGQWADVAEGAIFKKWGVVKEFPDDCRKVGRGLDFGYMQDPSACVKCGIKEYPDGIDLYIDEQFYAPGMLSSDLVRELRKDPAFVWADSADPRLIDEIALGGIIIYNVIKGPGSIIAGIDKMLTFRNIFVTERSTNLQNELRNYTWEKDRDGNFTNQPVDAYNHLIDAARYYVLGCILGKYVKTPKAMSKNDLGIF